MNRRNDPDPILVADKVIGCGQPTLIVAEIGVNHNGDMELAKEAIRLAAESGADAVKFQNFRAEEFVTDKSLTYTYKNNSKEVTENQFDMFKRLEMDFDQLGQLKELCESLGVVFFSTPTSERGISELVEIGTPLIKNGSDALTHLPLIHAMGKTGLPVVLSTGMADLEDIDSAVKEFYSTGNDQLILLACTSMYPTPAEQTNVSRVKTLADAFGCLTGFSDHTDGVTAAVLSTAYGSCFLEKHFTVDKSLPGPDHRFSMDPEELKFLVRSVREAELQIGDGVITPTVGERAVKSEYRFSMVAAKNLKIGETLAPSDVRFSRPATGLPPKMLPYLKGRFVKNAILEGQQIKLGDFE